MYVLEVLYFYSLHFKHNFNVEFWKKLCKGICRWKIDIRQDAETFYVGVDSEEDDEQWCRKIKVGAQVTNKR